MAKLWFDDIREPPLIGWEWAKTVEEAIAILEKGEVIECSLDHDIAEMNYGDPRPANGEDLCKWMISNLIPTAWPLKITIHSWNASGAKNMASLLETWAPKRAEVFIRKYGVK